MGRVMRCLLHRRAHRRGRPEHAVEARVVDHLDDRRHTASLLADEPRPRGLELDLARRVRAVAELVLQPLDVEAVARAVRQHARDEEAREAAFRLRQHEERVAHRRRAEPLVARQLVLAVAERPRCRRVRAHVGAALPFRHGHAAERAALLVDRSQSRVVGESRQPRLPFGREIGLRAQRGDRRVRHRDRAPVPGLHLRHQIEERSPRHVRSGARFAPRERVQPALDARLQQRVPGGMELHLVDPVAEAIVRAEPRRVLVRQAAPLERLSAQEPAELARVLGGPACAFALQRLCERPVLARTGRNPRAAAAGSTRSFATTRSRRQCYGVTRASLCRGCRRAP